VQIGAYIIELELTGKWDFLGHFVHCEWHVSWSTLVVEDSGLLHNELVTCHFDKCENHNLSVSLVIVSSFCTIALAADMIVFVW